MFRNFSPGNGSAGAEAGAGAALCCSAFATSVGVVAIADQAATSTQALKGKRARPSAKRTLMQSSIKTKPAMYHSNVEDYMRPAVRVV